ncbi:MAG: hypothetical protein ACXWKP_29810 [Bradyrhizobium sp.]
MAPIEVPKCLQSIVSRRVREALSRRFVGPVFDPLRPELGAIIAGAWDGYSNSRKGQVTRKAEPGSAYPDCDLSVVWLASRGARAHLPHETKQRRRGWMKSSTTRIRSRGILVVAGLRVQSGYTPSTTAKTRLARQLARAGILP